jgi:hypothetical protein
LREVERMVMPMVCQEASFRDPED